MKRFLKILGITLGSLLGVIIVVVGVTVGVLCKVVFSPKHLTPVVQQVCDSLVAVPHEVGNVNLTLWHTFPHFGLEIDGLYVMNPMEGAQSDTLLGAPKVYVGINLQEYLDNQQLDITSVELPDVTLNAYIGEDGHTNFDVNDLLRLESDTTEDNDTSALVLPFNIALRSLTLNTRNLTFVDRKDSLDIRNLSLRLDAAAAADSTLSEIAAEVRELSVDWEGLNLSAVGHVNMLSLDTIGMVLDVKTNTWNIGHVLSIIPEQYARLVPKAVSVDGDLALKANICGQYADSTLMPEVDAVLTLSDGKGAYSELPYTLEAINGRVTAHVDLIEKQNTVATIESLSARTKQTKLSATGTVSDIFNDMLIDLRANLDANIPDFAYFLPEGMKVDGSAKGTATARIHLSDLTDMKLERGLITGDLNLNGIHYLQDSMEAKLPKTHLTFRIPNNAPSRKKVNWLTAAAELDGLDFHMGENMQAKLEQSTLSVEAGNVLSKDPVLYAALGLSSAKPLVAAMDSMGGTIVAPCLKAYAEYNTKDTAIMPVLKADLAFDDLRAYYTDIDAHLTRSSLSASLSGGHKDKSAPRLKASLATDAVQAKMGEDMSAKTGSLSLEASARYNSRGKNLLLKWNPRLSVKLKDGEAHTDMLPVPVYIPSIDFAYSNKTCEINDSRILLGKSDFSLTGRVDSIGRWMRHKADMVGELTFTSDYTDINELMAMFSADSGSEEVAATADASGASGVSGNTGETAPADTTAKPFMVPMHVDLTLNTNIKNAVIWDEHLSAMGGRLYIKDGIVGLEQMGFVCKAAKLQLTALYRTPYRDHIYVGFDYHMLDVDIAELIHMIPQLDTLLPMLRSFAGQAEFHLAAETFVDEHYKPKFSTLRGAASVFGRDLTVLDNETFSTIAKLLTFKKRTENKIDSVSAELTVYKDEIEVFPFCVSWDKYMVALGGQHNLDMSFNYDINVLSPIYLGVNVSGNLDDLQIKLAKCKFAQDFRPIIHGNVDRQSADIRSRLRESMRKNVKIQ